MSLPMCTRCGVRPVHKTGSSFCGRTCQTNRSIQHVSTIQSAGETRAAAIAAARCLPAVPDSPVVADSRSVAKTPAFETVEDQDNEATRARGSCIHPGCAGRALVATNGEPLLYCSPIHMQADKLTKPSSLGDPNVVRLNSDGLAVHLFPNALPKFSSSHRVIPKGQLECSALQRAVRLSMMDARSHLSMALHPFCQFWVEKVVRIEDAVRWWGCQQRPQATSGAKWKYLFHGTSHYAARQLQKELFIKSESGDYGEGVYLTEASTAAHLFAMDKVICPMCFPKPDCDSPPTFMKFIRDTTVPSVKCAKCHKSDVAKFMYHRCPVCSQSLCRRCGEKYVNGDGMCDMLLCLVNVGEVHSVEKRSLLSWDTLCANNGRGWVEWIVADTRRVYPCYRFRYWTDVALAAAVEALFRA